MPDCRALQITDPGKAEIIDLKLPDPAPEEVLVELEGIATCPHWDRHILEGRPMFEGMKLEYPYWPGQPGHEAVGRIVATGRNVPEAAVGRRIAIWRDAGPYRRGMYATHGLVPYENVIGIPEDLALEKAASLELAMCVQVSVDQLNELEAVSDHSIAVAGLGPAGLVAIQLLRAAGAGSLCAIDPLANRREQALKLGVQRAVDPSDDTLPHSRSDENAFHAALDTTGLKGSIEPLMGCTRRAVAIFGVLREEVRFGPAQWYGGFSLLGYGEHNRLAAERALRSVQSGELDLGVLVTHKMPLSRYAEGVEKLQSMEAVKILFDPWT